MSQIKISACLVVHNEEKLIGRCLKSLGGAVDEIIVVHDGSCSDQTLTIVKSFGAIIFERDFIGIAEPHRPFSFEQASGDWILQIDADEYLSEELRSQLRSLAETKDVAAYEFLWPLWDGAKVGSQTWPYKRCFFRRDNLFFLGLPQFVAGVSGRVLKSALVLKHEPEYNNYSWPRFQAKWRPWAKLQAQYYLRDFREVTKFNYNGLNWPRQIIIRKTLPLLVAPGDFLLVFFRTLGSGAYRLGLRSLKIALMQGAYRFLVDYYLFTFKFKK